MSAIIDLVGGGGMDMRVFYSRALVLRRQLALSLTFLGGALLTGCGGPQEAPPPPPLSVKVVAVEKRDIPISQEFVGRTVGAIDADVRARVDGVVTGVFFEEGGEVSEGQLLYTIDPAPVLTKVAQAKGTLAEAESAMVQANADLARIKPLAAIDAVSKRDLDNAIARQGVSQGALDAAKAAVEAAEIELSYTKVTSPTSGTIGISKAKVGEYVGRPPNPTILNTVSKLDPIHVQFSLSEREYLFFSRLALENGSKKGERVLELILADGTTHPYTGVVQKLDRSIDVKSGAVTVEAAFPNPNKLLRPGLFAKVRTVAVTRSGVLVVPKKAVRELQGKQQVFVVDPQGKVEQRGIEVGPTAGELQIVESGLSEGDVVAAESIQKLRTGMTIDPQRISVQK
jgi:membrane fusion protein (multidrug efflux system)